MLNKPEYVVKSYFGIRKGSFCPLEVRLYFAQFAFKGRILFWPLGSFRNLFWIYLYLITI